MSRDLKVPFLGAVPIDADVVISGDAGIPIVAQKPESAVSKAYFSLGAQLAAELNATAPSAIKPFVWDWNSDHGAPPWRENLVRRNGSPRTPVGIKKRDARTLSVLWEDGRQHDYDVRELRLACPCALCIEEMSGRKILDAKMIRADVAPKTVSAVGNYALTISWSDGHSSGIYSHDLLRTLGERFMQGAQDV